MKLLSALVLGAAALGSLAWAARPWNGSYAAFKGEYLVYSGALGEVAAPTRGNRKAALVLHGEVARDLFESIGPDLKDACGTPAGLRVRQKGDLDCSHDKGNRSSPYICRFGIDLRTGKSTSGAIC
jgi:hypothetical protein